MIETGTVQQRALPRGDISTRRGIAPGAGALCHPHPCPPRPRRRRRADAGPVPRRRSCWFTRGAPGTWWIPERLVSASNAGLRRSRHFDELYGEIVPAPAGRVDRGGGRRRASCWAWTASTVTASYARVTRIITSVSGMPRAGAGSAAIIFGTILSAGSAPRAGIIVMPATTPTQFRPAEYVQLAATAGVDARTRADIPHPLRRVALYEAEAHQMLVGPDRGLPAHGAASDRGEPEPLEAGYHRLTPSSQLAALNRGE